MTVLRPLVAVEIKQILNPCHKTLEYEYDNCAILPVQVHENQIIFNLVIEGLGLRLKNFGINYPIRDQHLFDTFQSMALWRRLLISSASRKLISH